MSDLNAFTSSTRPTSGRSSLRRATESGALNTLGLAGTSSPTVKRPRVTKSPKRRCGVLTLASPTPNPLTTYLNGTSRSRSRVFMPMDRELFFYLRSHAGHAETQSALHAYQ